MYIDTQSPIPNPYKLYCIHNNMKRGDKQTTIKCMYLHTSRLCKTVPRIPNRYGGELIKMHLLSLSLCCPSRYKLLPIFISVDPAYERLIIWRISRRRIVVFSNTTIISNMQLLTYYTWSPTPMSCHVYFPISLLVSHSREGSIGLH